MGLLTDGETKKAPPPQNLLGISYDNETWSSYILPKEDPNNIWITWHIPWALLTSAFFQRKSANFSMSRNTDFGTLFLILLTFFKSFNIVLINIVTILKIKVFWNEGHDVIIFLNDISNKIYHLTQIILQTWSCDQSLVIPAFLCEKLS